MGFHQKRGGDQFYQLPALAVMMIVVLLETNCCRAAAVVVKSNSSSTTYQCNGLNGCRIEEADLELELDFFMDSNIIRILQTQGGSTGENALIAGSQAVKPCAPGTPYGQCLPKPNPEAEKCGKYDRDPNCKS